MATHGIPWGSPMELEGNLMSWWSWIIRRRGVRQRPQIRPSEAASFAGSDFPRTPSRTVVRTMGAR